MERSLINIGCHWIREGVYGKCNIRLYPKDNHINVRIPGVGEDRYRIDALHYCDKILLELIKYDQEVLWVDNYQYCIYGRYTIFDVLLSWVDSGKSVKVTGCNKKVYTVEITSDNITELTNKFYKIWYD